MDDWIIQMRMGMKISKNRIINMKQIVYSSKVIVIRSAWNFLQIISHRAPPINNNKIKNLS